MKTEWPNDATAFEYLRERGISFAADHWLAAPGFDLTDKDKSALQYLHVEWGYPAQVFENVPTRKH